MSLSTVLAKALFDNAAESPEELAFRKGDILMVLEQEQSGSPGWWLCSLHGRQGIAPANRLRLLQTPPPPPAGPGSDPRQTPAEDQVYLSPGPPLARTEDSTDGVYRSPAPVLGEALYQSPAAAAACRPGELRRAEGGRPRSRSSSGTRPRPDWDAAGGAVAAGRPRSPSLRGRDADALYQTPAPPSPLVASQHHRSLGGLAAESVYLSPRAAGAAAAADDDTYLVPRETAATMVAAVVAAPAGPSDGCYLVPRGTAASSGEDVYQTPTGGGGAGPAPANGFPQPRGAQEPSPALYQSPTPVGAHRTPQNSAPGEASPRPQHKAALRPPAAGQGGKPGPAPLRGSPLLARQARAPGSPNFARKPPPPAPPVRGVTRKDFAQSAATAQPAPGPVGPQPRRGGAGDGRGRGGRAAEERRRSGDAQAGGRSRKAEDGRNGDDDNQGDDEQVYDTPPSSRWQRPAPAPCDDDSIYNTPRALPPPADQGSEVYDVPTIILSLSSDSQPLKRYSAEEEADDDDDVYSVPTLPGLLPVAPGDAPSAPEEGGQRGQVYSVPGPGKRAPDPGDSSEPDCGIYDMPALAPDVLPPPPPSSSSSSSSSSTRRLSVSSNDSGDVQWRASLPCLVQSVLCSASSPSATSRDLAASLADVLSVWKAGQSGEPAPPLQQAWARLSDLLPALSACGAAPPPEALLASVQRALEDAAALLQTQSRPRLPSQDSLSRRPLPALPAADGKPAGGGGGGGGGGGMGSRKGSWIQERPLPPTPQPAFPLPPAPPSSVTMTLGPSDGEEDSANEYAGIGLAPPALAPVPAGDSVGYVKLQGKPEPPPDAPTENGHAHTDTTEPRLSPSPPLPASLSLEDSELLSFYSSQSLAHLSCLADSIDLLFASVQGNQPPRVFVSRGKSLIVTAHKLVFIGDTLSRLLASPDLRTKVTTSGGRLCQALKAVVVATKGAAQNYPSVSATQEMVDRVAELSQHAAGFSGLLQRLAEIS